MRCSFNFILVFCLVLTMMGFQCGKEVASPAYKFSEKFSLTPYKKIYTINDTIQLQFRTNDKTLIDQLSNRAVSTDSTYMLLQFQYVNLAFTSTNLDTLCYSTTPVGINQGLKVAGNYTVVDINTNCATAPFYNIEVGFIPKKKGIFGLYLPSAIGFFSCPGRATTFPVSILSFSYNLPDCNKDVYLSIPASQRNNSQHTEDLIDQKQIFAFQVQ